MVVAVFYTSSHGFGHASRDFAVIRAIQQRQPSARVVLRTMVPRWFVEAAAMGPVVLQPADIDTGVVQIDSLQPDEDETARRAARFYADFDRRVRDEAAVLRQLDASIVVGDIPPLAFAAAHQAQVPSVALGNFTWDWIYSGYPQFERLAPGVLDVIRAAYATTTRALRLPFHGGFEPMARVTRDIPLIARRATHTRHEVRRALDLNSGNDDRPIVLASFGGYGVELPYGEIARAERFTLVVTDHEARAHESAPFLKRVTQQDLAARGFGYEDLVAASDVVVSKPGYGIVSECIANDAALLYTSRGRFVEHDVFVSEMPRVLRCRYIDRDDLMAGRWADAIDELLQQPPPPERLPLNGIDVAVEDILDTPLRPV